jgi:cyclase
LIKQEFSPIFVFYKKRKMMIGRRDFLKYTGIGISAAPALSHWFIRLLQDSQYEMVPLRNDTGLFIGRGGTIGWYMKGDEVVIVDTQFPDAAGELIQRVREKTSQPISLLINTHHHGDHTAGNIAFKGIVRQHVAHVNSKANQQRVAEARGQTDTQLYPDTTFEDEWSAKVGDENIRLHYFGPAHTDGDAYIHFENANVVHTGDLMFNRRFPFIDKSAGASIANWIEVLGKARNTFDTDTIYIFGHAGENHPVQGNQEDLKAMENYLSRLLEHVRAQVKAGKSKDEIVQSTPIIPGADEWQGSGIQRSIDAAWTEIVEEK